MPISHLTITKWDIYYLIRRMIEMARGNMSQAAKRLGLHRSNLYRKMRQLEMGDAQEDADDELE